jgi:hypothetical protein
MPGSPSEQDGNSHGLPARRKPCTRRSGENTSSPHAPSFRPSPRCPPARLKDQRRRHHRPAIYPTSAPPYIDESILTSARL